MRAILIHPRDNVATLLSPAQAGERVAIAGMAQTVVVPEALPLGHKFAVHAITQQDAIIKYGEVIGYATQNIAIGMHVHVHNLVSGRGRTS